MALGANSLKILAVVSAYWVVSISMVFLNKFLLTKEGASIPAPFFVTWYQCLVTVIVCIVLGIMGQNAPKDSWFAQFPAYEYRIDIGRQVLPLSAVFVAMITFNNLCLKYVEVSFYNVARSLTICFNVALTYVFLGQKTSYMTMSTLLIVVIGFFTGSGGEVNFSLLGTLFGVSSSVFVSLNSILTKKTLGYVDDNQWKLTLYNNLNATFMFLPMILFFEYDQLIDNMATLFSPFFWLMMSITGVFGFMIGIVTVLQIKLTSPLTHNISGTAKACAQTILALMIYKNPITVSSGLGIVLVILGSSLYTYVKHQEMNAEKAKNQPKAQDGQEMETKPLNRA